MDEDMVLYIFLSLEIQLKITDLAQCFLQLFLCFPQ